MTMHFSTLNLKHHCASQSYKSSKSNEILENLWGPTIIFTSSANNFNILLIPSGKSLTKSRKSKGPNTLPWGTPDKINLIVENTSPTLTLIDLPTRKTSKMSNM